MRIEYWKITSVFKDDDKWAQLCHVKWIITNAEYQNCEVLMPRWLSSLPRIWDVVAICEIYNAEIVVLWVLEQFDLNLLPWEAMLHWWTLNQSWQNSSYKMQAKLKVNKDNEIEIQTLDVNWTVKASVLIQQDWQMIVDCTWKITLKSDVDIELNAPTVHVV